MQIHNLKREHKNKKDRLVGRGGKHAKTSGRGGKGQTARAGNKRRPELRDIIKKLPKNRGYKFNSFAIKPIGVSLDTIIKSYPKGGEVNPTLLLESKIIKKVKGWIPKIKILNGKDDIIVKIQVSKCFVSDSAKEKIIKAGGEVISEAKEIKKEKEIKIKEKKEEIKVKTKKEK
ncbi:MAG: 50S ribosomal protein L15 [Candidatus Nomurabacteria bacterium GW2011_GWE1_32_28]|uniref:Large ribosomal subunit protein uL15 n=1 Tax=Candidatus Nomurabacteria bacterium GW2011_GWF1_31_48 TaxID=1618767 RepID=A0A0G0AUE3_9BACT|nr:MAG: 50S ribosomal protein L15 [Candidatus Nomurabacteria bacterium GW2011_GWF2_30_133]KKP28703.1 MAG: 50S ribosomal protein L15 [Candidatus Nomurabacteria bacterium GW2011_GWE2_31_40]KKP30280.1 MAG: 50S ribosomal protein L15 [Candidatus Nomurabacteria bacterium GW2011_GWF1_31_48]KKP34807.1 MAG: 50S ribosomal protein L15 [Candidatus Nomurabacteria bacterium GW2011_GWE1_32_28]HAS80735.1 50S ribosomal protein L15 [Candidatus Nomurabacteria bacterium]